MHGAFVGCCSGEVFPLDQNVRSEMAAPLSEGDRTVGALNVDAAVANAFNPEDFVYWFDGQ